MNKKTIATEVCAELPPLIETHVDCSLCTIGWPMDNGWLRVSFWGPTCKQYWRVNNNGVGECVHQVSPPANAIGGPYYWSETCVSGGGGISSDPYWCLNNKVQQSPTKPGDCATGPYTSFQAALAACQDSAVTRYPSMWIMGTDTAYGDFKCLQPGDDAEPNPAIWACDYTVDQYRIQAQVTPEIVNNAPTGGLTVSVTVKRLGPRSVWFTYCTFSATIQEDVCTAANPLPWRRRYWKSSYIPVTVNAAGGLGDPVSAARIEATALGMRMGCGYPNEWEIDPICGFGDGDGWYTCARAHVEAPYYNNLNPALPGVLFPLGVRSVPGNNPQNPQQIYFAECDVIYKNQFNQLATRFNHSNGTASAAFIQTYRQIGAAGRAPQAFINQEANDSLPQQIQIEDKNKLCLKSFGSAGVLWLGYRNPITEEWEVVAPTKVQPQPGDTTSHLHIWTATFPLSAVAVTLYAMRFPSPSTLPAACVGQSPAQMLPPSEPQETSVQMLASKLLAGKASVSQALIERVKSPCVHRGGRLALMGYG
jgi:hypothetical protein